MNRTLRMWCGKVPYEVTGRLIRDTGSGLIIEDTRGQRYFAFNNDVLDKGGAVQVVTNGDLFGAI